MANPDASAARRSVIITTLGLAQILSWGTTFYLLAVLAGPIVRDTGWSYDVVIAGLSTGLLVAGFVSPRVGREIARRGGRPVLALGSLVIATGLVIIGAASKLPAYFFGWLVLGVGMGAGLYDAAFSTLGSIYGKEARSAITAVTLFGGFASTVCWPLSAALNEQFSWRVACFVYAAIHVGIALPAFLLALPRRAAAEALAGAPAQGAVRLLPQERLSFAMLACAVTVAAAILATVGTHLVHLLEGRGLPTTAAVGLGMLIGPSAVGARIVEGLAGRHYHPLWTMTASASLVAIGVLLLSGDIAVAWLAIIFYAAGNGIGSIARGTVPLALFGPTRYPVLMGRLGLPIMIAMAIGPYVGAWAFARGGPGAAIAVVGGFAALNAVFVGALWVFSRALRKQALNPA